MNREVWLGHRSARFIYYSYKDSPYFLLLLATIVLSIIILLVFSVIIPQVESWSAIRDEVDATRQRIGIIKSNIVYMSRLDKNALENNRKTVVRALPVEKDFGFVVDSVVDSSLRSGVSIDDFVFSVGSISSESAVKAKGGGDNLEAITISLSVKASIDGITAFIKELGEKLPLNEVKSVETGEGSTSVMVVFYSKNLNLKKAPDDQPIRPITAANGSILKKLSVWAGDRISSDIPERSDDIPLF
jgi:hypothetical protein